MLRKEVMPLSFDYPVYLLYSAMNSGKKKDLCEAGEAILNSGSSTGHKWTESAVLTMALSQVRLHLLAAYAMYRGADPQKALDSLSSKEEETKFFGLPSHAIKKDFKPPEKKKPLSENRIREIVKFVEGPLSETCPEGVHPRVWVFNRCLQNYMVVYRGISETRISSPERARSVFHRIMDDISRKESL